MLLPPQVAAGVADGTVTLAFRRWQHADVQPGARFRTSAGVVEVTSVDVVDPAALTDADARAAGLPDAAALRALLDPGAVARRRSRARYGRAPAPDRGADAPDTAAWPVHRVGLAWAGPDPRIALRESADLTDDDVAAIDARLDRLDRAATHVPWTAATLDVIRRRPHVRAPDLAAELGRERDPFKLDVRKLKALDLTQSFEVGYALSPRGEAYVARSRRRG
ncbi:hypothetical protein [Cellulomonas phragmiteti]|uniref:ASCH domain-containing protein n=1 Tax=Cellulomonas phragmiteti TaxID=478780 RepID=A0ABQ4DPL9_9CELL|nr:hypothetical protein [Cellulomonas phragmiteti]GIG41303.1 hypothetical protein Cph01nite_30650 [Cellulomonas phragmiteti]